MFMKKTRIAFCGMIFGLTLMILSGCSSGSGSLAKLAETYAEIADNTQKLYDAYQAIYGADKKDQEKLLKKATSIGDDVKKSNERLAKKASGIAEQLRDTEIAVSASPLLDIKVGKGTFTTVNASDAMVNIVVEIPFEGTWNGSGYLFFVDRKGKILTRSMAHESNNSFFVNFHIISNKGTESAEYDRDIVARISKIVLVSADEYNRGEIAGKKQKANSESESAREVKVKGVKIVEGAGLAKTLGKFSDKDLEWGYNEDYGLSVTVGNVWIMIDIDDLTPKGVEILDSYDMESDLEFSVKYIDPSAKITDFEVQ